MASCCRLARKLQWRWRRQGPRSWSSKLRGRGEARGRAVPLGPDPDQETPQSVLPLPRLAWPAEHPRLPPGRRFRVEGMTCSSCSAAVESCLAALPGVRHAAVSLTLQEAKVEYEAREVDEVRAVGAGRCGTGGTMRGGCQVFLATRAAPNNPLPGPPSMTELLVPMPPHPPPPQAQLRQAIEDAGFGCAPLGSGEASSLALALGGLSCSACSAAVEAALRGTEGVLEANVLLLTSKAEVGRG